VSSIFLKIVAANKSWHRMSCSAQIVCTVTCVNLMCGYVFLLVVCIRIVTYIIMKIIL